MSKNIVFFYTRDRYLIKIQDFNVVKVFQDLEKIQSKPSRPRHTRARSGATSLVVAFSAPKGNEVMRCVFIEIKKLRAS